MRIIAVLWLVVGIARAVFGQTSSVTVIWDASTSPGVAGYRLYWGVASRVYTNTVDVGTGTNCTLLNINRSISRYFAATAYDTNGIESYFSNEAVLRPPIPPTNVVTFSVQVLASSNVSGPYVVVTNLPAFSRTNPMGEDYIRARVGVTMTNIAK